MMVSSTIIRWTIKIETLKVIMISKMLVMILKIVIVELGVTIIVRIVTGTKDNVTNDGNRK